MQLLNISSPFLDDYDLEAEILERPPSTTGLVIPLYIRAVVYNNMHDDWLADPSNVRVELTDGNVTLQGRLIWTDPAIDSTAGSIVAVFTNAQLAAVSYPCRMQFINSQTLSVPPPFQFHWIVDGTQDENTVLPGEYYVGNDGTSRYALNINRQIVPNGSILLGFGVTISGNRNWVTSGGLLENFGENILYPPGTTNANMAWSHGNPITDENATECWMEIDRDATVGSVFHVIALGAPPEQEPIITGVDDDDQVMPGQQGVTYTGQNLDRYRPIDIVDTGSGQESAQQLVSGSPTGGVFNVVRGPLRYTKDENGVVLNPPHRFDLKYQLNNYTGPLTLPEILPDGFSVQATSFYDGTRYGLVLPAGSPDPDYAQIEANGISMGVSGLTPSILAPSGLEPVTTYDWHEFLRDSTDGDSAIQTLRDVTTSDQPSSGPDPEDILGPERTIDWSLSGVTGGIPARTTIYQTLPGGSSQSAIQTALNNCPDDQTVLLEAGTFNIGTLTIPSNVTLRGAGAGSTTINFTGGSGIVFGGTNTPSSGAQINITGGATKGSTDLVLANAASVSVGNLLLITQLNDTSYVYNNTTNGTCSWCDGIFGGTRLQGQIARVTAKNGNTVTISVPLFLDYTLTPTAIPYTPTCEFAGLEDVTLYANNNGTTNNFTMSSVTDCWVKGIHCDYTDGNHGELAWAHRCEVRDSYFEAGYVHTAGQQESCLFIIYKTTGTLVENNTFRRLHASVVLNWGAAGNVIAYNYMDNNFDTYGYNTTYSNVATHGSHPQFNLIEGNIMPVVDFDYYWGSTAHNVVHRNWLTGVQEVIPPLSGRGPEEPQNAFWTSQALRGVDFTQCARFCSLTGNIIGAERQKTVGNWTPSVEWPTSRSYYTTNNHYGYSFGYANLSDGGGDSGNTTDARTTAILHGDYNYVDQTFTWDGVTSQNIPASYYRSSAPPWWGAQNWPAFGPDPDTPTNVIIDSIPAKDFFDSGGWG